MAHALSAHAGQAGDLVDGQQFIHSDPVIDEGGYAVLLAQGAGDHGAYVGGMLVLGLVFELPYHVVVDLVGARLDGGEQAAPGDDAGEGLQGHAVLFQRRDDQVPAELILVGHTVEGSELLGRMSDGFGKEGRFVLEHRDLGGGGAGIQDQQFFHSCFLLSGPRRQR